MTENSSSASSGSSGSSPRVAVIGLGAMGLPMATRLAETFPVAGFDPWPERRSNAEAGGVSPALTPAEAAQDADVVIVAVRDYSQTRDALFGANGAATSMRPGALVVLTSTIGPDSAIDAADELARRGFLAVDAPVSGGPARAGLGDLLIVVGAAPDALEIARPVLERLASTLVVVGQKPGDGQKLKVVNQLLAGIHIAAAAEALALATAMGLDPESVIASLSEGAASSFMFTDRGPRMLQAYTGGAPVKSRVDIFVKDMGIVTGIAKQVHIPTPLAAAAEQLYLMAEKSGLATSDDSSVITMLSPVEP